VDSMRSRPKATARTTDLPPAPPTTDSLAASFTASARRQNDGRRSLPPTEPAPVPRLEQETWRERPRCARRRWPRARPEGSLTPWLSLSQSVSAMVSRAAEVPCVRASITHDCVHVFPDELVLYFPDMWVHKRGVFMCVSQLKPLPGIVLEIVSHVTSIWHPLRLPRV
jgi:hypothetical protein